MFTKQPTMDMDIEFDIKLLATEFFEGTVRDSRFLYFFCYHFSLRDNKYFINEIQIEEYICTTHT